MATRPAVYHAFDPYYQELITKNSMSDYFPYTWRYSHHLLGPDRPRYLFPLLGVGASTLEELYLTTRLFPPHVQKTLEDLVGEPIAPSEEMLEFQEVFSKSFRLRGNKYLVEAIQDVYQAHYNLIGRWLESRASNSEEVSEEIMKKMAEIRQEIQERGMVTAANKDNLTEIIQVSPKITDPLPEAIKSFLSEIHPFIPSAQTLERVERELEETCVELERTHEIILKKLSVEKPLPNLKAPIQVVVFEPRFFAPLCHPVAGQCMLGTGLSSCTEEVLLSLYYALELKLRYSKYIDFIFFPFFMPDFQVNEDSEEREGEERTEVKNGSLTIQKNDFPLLFDYMNWETLGETLRGTFHGFWSAKRYGLGGTIFPSEYHGLMGNIMAFQQMIYLMLIQYPEAIWFHMGVFVGNPDSSTLIPEWFQKMLQTTEQQIQIMVEWSERPWWIQNFKTLNYPEVYLQAMIDGKSDLGAGSQAPDREKMWTRLLGELKERYPPTK